MVEAKTRTLARVLDRHGAALLELWMTSLSRGGRYGAAELETLCRSFIAALRSAVATGNLADILHPDYEKLREFLEDFARSRALQGLSPSETAQFVFSLRPRLFDLVRENVVDAREALEESAELSLLIDQLGLYAAEAYQKSREELILRQQQEIAELSTPVVKLWQGILALPLIGTLDSARTQVVMESLLQSIVDYEAEIAIIDITGVPTVDTLVAQHLLKTIAAARLMGADCVISGIRPQIAQTMVHLGVELNVVSKPTLADAFAVALTRIGRSVVPTRSIPARS